VAIQFARSRRENFPQEPRPRRMQKVQIDSFFISEH
jgi:hypothetical protein